MEELIRVITNWDGTEEELVQFCRADKHTLIDIRLVGKAEGESRQAHVVFPHYASIGNRRYRHFAVCTTNPGDTTTIANIERERVLVVVNQLDRHSDDSDQPDEQRLVLIPLQD